MITSARHEVLSEMGITRQKVNKGMERIGWKKRLLSGGILLLIIIALTILFAPFITVYYVTRGPVVYQNEVTEKFPLQGVYEAADFDLEEKMIPIRTDDGYSLWASEIEVQNPKAVIIYLTGIRQPSITYFYAHAKWMKEESYASVLLEVRGHGQSQGDGVGLGYTEVSDVQAVVDYLLQDENYQDVPIIVQGVSMGGSIAVNSFGKIPQIDGLIAMSAYSSFEDVVIDTMRRHGVPELLCKIERPLVKMALSFVFGREKVNTLNPIEQIANANGRPALFIASKDDKEVLAKNLERFRAVYPEGQYWIRDSWEHFIVKDCDFLNVTEDKEYCSRILQFLEQVVLIKK